MTLISQFKSKFKTDCEAIWAMCWRAGCLILSLNIWRGESGGTLPEPSQLFPKYSNTLACRRTFQISPHQNSWRPPILPISLWLTYILSHRPAWLTQLSGRSCKLVRSLTSRVPPLQQLDPVCCRTAASSDKTIGESFSSLHFLEVDLKEGLSWYL